MVVVLFCVELERHHSAGNRFLSLIQEINRMQVPVRNRLNRDVDDTAHLVFVCYNRHYAHAQQLAFGTIQPYLERQAPFGGVCQPQVRLMDRTPVRSRLSIANQPSPAGKSLIV